MGLLLPMVLANIVLQLIGAAMVKYTASLSASQYLLMGGMLLALLALAFGRFLIWNAIHKRYPISVAYPASALFFPAVVALAHYYGEPVSAHQMLGAGVVTAGVLALIATSAWQDR